METAANFSQWIKPFLNNFPQITKPKQFDVYKLKEDTVVRVRDNCGIHSEPWRGLNPNEEYTMVSTFICVFT